MCMLSSKNCITFLHKINIFARRLKKTFEAPVIQSVLCSINTYRINFKQLSECNIRHRIMLACYFQREKFLILSQAYRNPFIYTESTNTVVRLQNVFIFLSNEFQLVLLQKYMILKILIFNCFICRMGLIIRSVAILFMVIVTTVSSILHILYKEEISKYFFSSSCAIKVSIHHLRINGMILVYVNSLPDSVVLHFK